MNNLVQQEEQKRERHWDPRKRWALIQEAISWAESQSTVQRNTPQFCLLEQKKKNAIKLMANEMHNTQNIE
jgi:hypothetical protein